MHNRMRAAAVAALVALASAPAPAQTSTGSQPATLPAVRARPPAGRRPDVRPTPKPVPPPVVRRPSVAPATNLRADSATSAGPALERWEDISAASANAGAYHLPVGRGHAGPSVLRVQVLLSRSFFSPGMLDGRWGRNTQTAIQWFQAREGLPNTGTVDSATYARLVRTAGTGETVRAHTLTEDDVRGPFVTIPSDIYAQARLSCSCYESLTEKLTERFHLTRELLRRLNPGVDLDRVAAGTAINVPAVRAADAKASGEIRQIVVSKRGNYLQALDANGRILYHFAATLGSSYDPSPNGDFMVTSVHENPWWNYQPKILAHVPDDRPDAMIPPGPNSSVGRVWMSLSAPHYGIHGTKSPETIGYAESAGCVRLTNWDVMFLSRQVAPGTPVAFRDTRGGAAPASAPATTAPAVLGTRADSARTDSAAARRDTARRDSTRRDTVRRDTARRDTARRTAPAVADTARRTPTPAPRDTQPARPARADTTHRTRADTARP